MGNTEPTPFATQPIDIDDPGPIDEPGSGGDETGGGGSGGGGSWNPPPKLIFKKIMKMKNDCWRDDVLFWTEGDPEFYFEVYRYDGTSHYIHRVYFACGANVYVKDNYNVTLLTISRSEYSQYNAISLDLKEEDGEGLGSDDDVELEWKATWLNPDEPAGNAFPYNKPDSPTLSTWYLGKRQNVNMFAVWVNI